MSTTRRPEDGPADPVFVLAVSKLGRTVSSQELERHAICSMKTWRRMRAGNPPRWRATWRRLCDYLGCTESELRAAIEQARRQREREAKQ